MKPCKFLKNIQGFIKLSNYEYTSNITPYRLHPLRLMRRTVYSLLPEIYDFQRSLHLVCVLNLSLFGCTLSSSERKRRLNADKRCQNQGVQNTVQRSKGQGFLSIQANKYLCLIYESLRFLR